MEIEICIGSSCHLKGSPQVIKKIQDYVKNEKSCEDLILKGSFCLGACTKGVSLKNEKKIYSVNEENCLQVLEEILEVTHAID